MNVPYWILLNMSGVTWPTIKLFIQFEDAPSAMPYGRLLKGQTSATTIQAAGPHEAPNAILIPVSQLNMKIVQDLRIYPYERNSSPPGRALRVPLELVLCENDRNEKMAECHDKCATRENRFTPNLVNIQYSR